jgi:hypothetical protein
MADHCSICDTRRPAGGTNILGILNSDGGELWIEFCRPCGEHETLTNRWTKETITVRELFDCSPTWPSKKVLQRVKIDLQKEKETHAN